MIPKLEQTVSYFDAIGVSYAVVGDDGEAVRTVFNAKNRAEVDVLSIFEQGSESVGLRSFDYCKFPDEKLLDVLLLCSRMNEEYRWIKFYIDEEDNTVTLAYDAFLESGESCGEQIYDLINMMVAIADEAYPDFMKTIWA